MNWKTKPYFWGKFLGTFAAGLVGIGFVYFEFRAVFNGYLRRQAMRRAEASIHTDPPGVMEGLDVAESEMDSEAWRYAQEHERRMRTNGMEPVNPDDPSAGPWRRAATEGLAVPRPDITDTRMHLGGALIQFHHDHPS